MTQQLLREYLLESKLALKPKKKESKHVKENSVYGEKNHTAILSVEVIVMQARSAFETHNYTECKISRSK